MEKVELKTDKFPVSCFAPELTEEKLARYEQLVNGMTNPEQKQAMQECLHCVKAWWELPESKRDDGDRYKVLHRGEEKIVQMVPLEADHVKLLDATTPWMRTLMTLSNSQETGLIDDLPHGELRNAVHHLIWLCKEITLDREPMTQAMLG